MLRLRAFSVFDAKAQAFGRPFFVGTDGEAIRVFSDAVRDASTPFGKHPEDYSLFRCGEFDLQSGRFSGIDGSVDAVECLLVGKQVEVQA